MRSRVRVVLVLVAVLAACGGDDDETQQPAEGPAAQRDTVREPLYPEAEAAQILRAINASEIATSRLARERSQNDDILRYASVMISDHGAMSTLLDSIVAPISDSANAESRRIREETQLLVDSMLNLVGGFNNTYIQDQVRAHEQTLLLLDTALIPSARTPELKKLLQDLRPAVVAHLQRARQIWTERQASGLAASTAPRPRATTPPPAPATPPPAQTDTTDTLPPPVTTTNM